MNKVVEKNKYLGVFAHQENSYLYSHGKKGSDNYYFVDSSKNGFKFDGTRKNFFMVFPSVK